MQKDAILLAERKFQVPGSSYNVREFGEDKCGPGSWSSEFWDGIPAISFRTSRASAGNDCTECHFDHTAPLLGP